MIETVTNRQARPDRRRSRLAIAAAAGAAALALVFAPLSTTPAEAAYTKSKNQFISAPTQAGCNLGIQITLGNIPASYVMSNNKGPCTYNSAAGRWQGSVQYFGY